MIGLKEKRIVESFKRISFAPFAFMVMIVLFQRAFGSYSETSLDYRMTFAAASGISWMILILFAKYWESWKSVFCGISFLLIVAAFLVQGYTLLGYPVAGTDEILLGLLVHVASSLLAVGSCIYIRLWIDSYERFRPETALVYIAGASGITAIVACAPPLILGVDLFGGVAGFVIRLLATLVSFMSLRSILQKPLDYGNEEVSVSTKAEVWQAIGLVIAACVVASLVQGLYALNSVSYRNVGAQLLICISPAISLGIIFLTSKYGKNTGYLSLFYWSLVVFASVMLLVSTAVADSSIGFLWVLQFASFAQFDIAFLGILASLRFVLGKSYFTLCCLLFFVRDAVFLLGRVINSVVDVSIAHLICVLAITILLIFEIVSLLLKNARGANTSKDENSSVPNELAFSISEQYHLSPRENEVLALIMQGRSYNNISERLFVSSSTIKTHANHIYAKLGVHSRDELIDFLNPVKH